MFNLDGQPTAVSRMAQTILDNSGLQIDPRQADSLALVLYRKDALDGHMYLTAARAALRPPQLEGVREETRPR